MPLIIVTGLPTSGKTTRARQLLRFLEEKIESSSPAKYRLHLVSDETLSISRTVYDLSPSKVPAHTRSANASEKDARAALYGAVKRVLSDKDIVVLDGLNYIKGWRYQLHCEAKAVRTPSVILQIGCVVDKAREVNEARLAGQKASAGGEPVSARADADSESPGAEGYETSNWENLVFRYEEPNAMNRWDSPLFTLIWEDGEEATRDVFSRLWDAIAGDGRKVVKPNQSTVRRKNDAGGDYLYTLDRETQDIVTRILEQQGEEGGGRVRIECADDPAASDLWVELPVAKLGLPQLQRLRRAFLGLNRGGFGLEGIGNLAVDRIRESFVGYLNDTFQRAE